MKNTQYESPIQNLLESLKTNFANTVNPKGSLEIEQLIVDGFLADQSRNENTLTQTETKMVLALLLQLTDSSNELDAFYNGCGNEKNYTPIFKYVADVAPSTSEAARVRKELYKSAIMKYENLINE